MKHGEHYDFVIIGTGAGGGPLAAAREKSFVKGLVHLLPAKTPLKIEHQSPTNSEVSSARNCFHPRN